MNEYDDTGPAVQGERAADEGQGLLADMLCDLADAMSEMDESILDALSGIESGIGEISEAQRACMEDASARMTTREQMKTILAAVERRDAEVSNKAFLRTMEQIALMREDFRRLCSGIRENMDSMSAEEVLSSFEAYSVDLENMLLDGGVYIGPFPYDRVNAMHQRIVGVVPTGDPEKSGTIASRESDGYSLGGRTLVKEKVCIYRLSEDHGKETGSETPYDRTEREEEEEE